MLRAIKINSQSLELDKVQKLYVKAFPDNERSPLVLLLDDNSNCSEIFAFYDNELFCGFISILTTNDISHILYFAIDETLRDKGYGTQALHLLKQLKHQNRILADIEVNTSIATNNEQRKKRKQFYMRNGYIPSGVYYDWRDESYEILINGGSLSEKEFWNFWECVGKINPDFERF